METRTYRQSAGLTSSEPTTTEFGWSVIEGIETDVRELGKEDFDKLFGRVCRLIKFHNGGHIAWRDLEDMLHAVCAGTGVRTKTKLQADIRAARKKVGKSWLAPNGESRPDDYEPSWVTTEAEVREYANPVAVEAIVRHSVPCVLFDDAHRWLMDVGVSSREAEFRRLVRRFAPRSMTVDEMRAVREVLPMAKVRNNFNVCTKLGYRLVFEMVGTDGEVKSIRLRRPVLKARRKSELKTLAIKGSVTHLLLANPEARALLRNRGKRPAEWGVRELHVVLTEGETDWLVASTEPSDAVRAVFGLTGPGQWCTRFAASIPDDALVFIATDSDPAGNKYARDAAQTLSGHRRLWRWRPWSVDDKGMSKFDLADVFGLRGGTSHAFGWFQWAGSHWEQDEAGEVYGHFREVTARLRTQWGAMPKETDEQKARAKAFGQFVSRTRSARSHDAVLKIASRDPKLVIRPGELDQQPTLLPCLNGTVDLTTGELREARREDLLNRVVPVEYNADAKAPQFEEFLQRIQPEWEMRDFLQRLLGYGLFGFVREHVFPIFYGDGANGKSVLAQAVQHVVGEYSQTVPRTLVVETGYEQHKTQIARLHRTRMGFIHETERDARLNVEAVKMLTGGDVLTGHFMRKDFFDFVPSHALYLLSNWKPQVDAAMRAVWRRLLLIPFDVEIPIEEQDLALPDKIVEAESAGVLRWLVEGAAWWWTFSQLQNGSSGLLPPKRVIDETKEYQLQEDIVGRFVDECCDVGKGRKVQAGKLYTAYKGFCQREGIEKPATSNKFADAVQRVKGADGRRIGKSQKSYDGRKYYDGIGLHAEDEQDPREVPDDDPDNWGF